MPCTKYICYRCNNYDTIRFYEIKSHILRKSPCNIKKDLILLSEDKILIFTLMPYYNNIHTIENKDIEHLENSNIINKNKNELFEEITYIEKNKSKKCKYCNEIFELINDLKKHVILKCFYNELIKRDNKDIKHDIIISNNTIDSNNTTNINYNNCDINNINLYLDLKTPIPFEDSWDLSQISNEKQFFIMMSEYMYSHLLEAILENDINNNVIIDSDKKSGSVYMNHNDKYISMKVKQIVEKSMEKLNEHLNIINKNNKATQLKDTIRYSRQIFNKKYIDYKKDKDLQKGVNTVISNIYETKIDNSKKIAENVIKIDNYNKLKKTEKDKTNNIYDSDEDDNEVKVDNNKKKGY